MFLISIFLLQSDDVQRAGWNLYRSTILLCSYVVFYRIDVGRVVDGVLLQTVLGRKADELASLDLLALKIDLRCGMLGAGVGNLQDYLARLLIECGCREDARKGVRLQLGGEYLLAIQLGEDAVAYYFQLDAWFWRMMMCRRSASFSFARRCSTVMNTIPGSV